MRILICEDNPIVALDLELTIEELGHVSAGIVASAHDCLRRCEARRPDLVLVDLDLSDGPTGLGIVRHLSDRDVRAIIVSGQARRVTAPPGVALLDKPLDPRRLSREIERLAAHAGRPAP